MLEYVEEHKQLEHRSNLNDPRSDFTAIYESEKDRIYVIGGNDAKNFTRLVSTMTSVLMNGLEWLNSMLQEIQQLVAYSMPNLFTYLVEESNFLQRKSLMFVRLMISRKIFGKLLM